MNIVIAFQDRQPSEQIAYLARRSVEHSLDRFAARIRDITVRIRDINADKGGIDQRCSLAVRTLRGQEFHLHDHDSRAENAVRRLARRAARLVRDSLRRRGQTRR